MNAAPRSGEIGAFGASFMNRERTNTQTSPNRWPASGIQDDVAGASGAGLSLRVEKMKLKKPVLENTVIARSDEAISCRLFFTFPGRDCFPNSSRTMLRTPRN